MRLVRTVYQGTYMYFISADATATVYSWLHESHTAETESQNMTLSGSSTETFKPTTSRVTATCSHLLYGYFESHIPTDLRCQTLDYISCIVIYTAS